MHEYSRSRQYMHAFNVSPSYMYICVCLLLCLIHKYTNQCVWCSQSAMASSVLPLCSATLCLNSGVLRPNRAPTCTYIYIYIHVGLGHGLGSIGRLLRRRSNRNGGQSLWWLLLLLLLWFSIIVTTTTTTTTINKHVRPRSWRLPRPQRAPSPQPIRGYARLCYTNTVL